MSGLRRYQGEAGRVAAPRGRRRARSGARSGFSTVELISTVGLVAVLVVLSIPSYSEAIEKRRIAQGAEIITEFVNTLRSEAIKRNRPVAVSYATQTDGRWCIGAVLGATPCDCTATEPAVTAFCALDGTPSVLRDTDIQTRHLIHSVSGDGSYVIDPVRGLLVDSRDLVALGLGTAGGDYEISLTIVPTGKVLACLPESSLVIQGFQPCTQGL